MKCKKCHKEIENLKVCPYCKAKQLSKKVNKKIEETEEHMKKITFFNDPKILTYIMIGLLFGNLILNSLTTNINFINFIFKNFINVFILIYFILLHSDFGKRKFYYLNIILLIVLMISFLTSAFNIFIEINIFNILNIISRGLLVLFFGKKFFKEDFNKLAIVNNIKDKNYFYLISIFYSFSTILNILNDFTIMNLFLGVIDIFIVIALARYIYVFYEVKSQLFKDINKKQEKINDYSFSDCLNEITDRFNLYQICSFIVIALGLVLGILLGSKYGNCEMTLYSNYCMGGSSFNFKVMFTVLFVSCLLGLFMYWQGEVINYLKSINNNKKKVKKSVKNID